MSAKPTSVRPVEERDEGNVFALLCMAYKENAPYRINPEKVQRMIADAARDKTTIIGVIDAPDDSGRIAGSIGAVFCQDWYTDEFHIGERWNFVHPEYRKSSFAKDLLNYAKWISDSMNMPLQIGILTAKQLEAKTRFYARQMPQVGAGFAYNMKAARGPIAEDMHGR